ncbi:alpha/beta hydrolase [Nocardia sp. CNY236]|uniref:alpha/beta hydrolase n=1 Tax=Nocardia sp. CNY236 TaxID=1169152 RepID=UPI00048A8774|nr:alpha/beta hydrolase [Nocardia sp. CNY236]
MRWTRAAVLAATVSIATAGCGVGPSDRPAVALQRPAVADTTTTSANPPPPPDAERPETDLGWGECPRSVLDSLDLESASTEVIFDCAEFATRIDAAGAIIGNFRAGAMRARLPQTPTDAPPVVLTSGASRASTATLAGLAFGSAAPLLAAHPIVAVDRRGIGRSQQIDCLPPEIRRGLADNAQFGPDSSDPVAQMMALSRDATIACRDFLQPYVGTFDAPHAADDIDELRKLWQVEHIMLLGIGNGANVALSYARKYGDHLARLILDSPEPVDTDAVTRTEYAVEGAEAAVAAFAQRCVGVGCSLGADPRSAIIDLVSRARAGELGDISASAVLTGLAGFLGDPRADQATRAAELSDALSAARDGDLDPLRVVIARGTAATESDGQFVNRCTDTPLPPTPSKATELASTWAERYPIFGEGAAVALMKCAAWPTTTAAPMPETSTVPVLVLGGVADPVVGRDGQPSVTGVLGAAGVQFSTLTWQGFGHPVSTHSTCAQQVMRDYLEGGRLPSDGSVCPA